MIKKCLWFAAIVVVIISCSKNSGTTKKVFTKEFINDSLKKHFSFSPGTHWIYKDSLNNKIDSFVIVSNDSTVKNIAIDYGTGNKKNPIDYSIIRMNVLEYNINTVPATLIYKFDRQLLSDRAFISPLVSHEDDYLELFFVYPFESGKTGLSSIYGSFTISNAVMPSYDLNGMNYLNVLKTNHVNSNSDNLFYVCPDIGIVKMKLNDFSDTVHHIWELQRYNIVR